GTVAWRRRATGFLRCPWTSLQSRIGAEFEQHLDCTRVRTLEPTALVERRPARVVAQVDIDAGPDQRGLR
ncbi:MAG: hypothetical protein ACRD8O_22520, partial [Bryobacteraceae bacterium]